MQRQWWSPWLVVQIRLIKLWNWTRKRQNFVDRCHYERDEEHLSCLWNTGERGPSACWKSVHPVPYDIWCGYWGLAAEGRFVFWRSHNQHPPNMMYANFLSYEKVRIALMMAFLHHLSVKTAEIINCYIKATCKEKFYTILGPDLWSDKGKLAVIVRALYGLKSAVALFQNHLADFMKRMGYKLCLDEPDLWIRQKTRKSNGIEY